MFVIRKQKNQRKSLKTKKVLGSALSIILVSFISFWVFEPSEIYSETMDTNVTLSVTSEINISCKESTTNDDTVNMSGSIPGQTGGSATGSFYCTVETNNDNGYNLKLKFKTDGNQCLMLTGGDCSTADKYFPNYTEGSPNLDYAWSAPSSGNEVFGFNITSGSDAEDAYKDNGVDTCGSGSISSDHCWNGLTTEEQVASSASPTPAGGTTTTFELKAEAAANNNLLEGTYTTIITGTATAP